MKNLKYGNHKRPFLSIIIPMYNRAATIRRCLNSCLSQNFEDYEVIVVDDASQDGSVAVVESYLPNPHIILVKSPQNVGVSAARGLGVAQAKGQWLLFIDSDDSFRPGAFQTIYEQAKAAPGEVGEIGFCHWSEEYNRIVPFPLMPEGILSFVDCLQWLNVVKIGDFLHCHRREIYRELSWPHDRRFERQFYLIVASKFKKIMSKQVVGTMHNDADNRISAEWDKPFDPKSLQTAYDNAIASLEILDEFGDDLKKYCPKRYKLQKRMVGNYYFRAGCRLKGCRYMLPYLVRHPLNVADLGLFLGGLIGPRTLLRIVKIFKKK